MSEGRQETEVVPGRKVVVEASPLAPRRGEGQVQRVDGWGRAEQDEQHHVQAHEAITGEVAPSRLPAPGTAIGFFRGHQAGGYAQVRPLWRARSLTGRR